MTRIVTNNISGFRDLDAFEHALMSRLLSASFPGREALAAQARAARVKWLQSPGAPALLFEVAGDIPTADVRRRIPVEAEGLDADGEAVHFLLHVVDGRMVEVEIYRDDGEALLRMPNPGDLTVMTLDEQ